MIFIGNFLFMTDLEQVEEQDRRYGEFSMVVEAPDKETAARLFAERLEGYRSLSEFFTGHSKLYLIQLMEFDAFPSTAIMLNYKSIAGDPVMPYIGCSIPTMENDSCRIFLWDQNQPEIDGVPEKPFMEFT